MMFFNFFVKLLFSTNRQINTYVIVTQNTNNENIFLEANSLESMNYVGCRCRGFKKCNLFLTNLLEIENYNKITTYVKRNAEIWS